MGLFDRLRGNVKVEDDVEPAAPAEKACTHPNRESIRTFGRGGSSANRWRCVNCGYSPVPEFRA